MVPGGQIADNVLNFPRQTFTIQYHTTINTVVIYSTAQLQMFSSTCSSFLQPQNFSTSIFLLQLRNRGIEMTEQPANN